MAELFLSSQDDIDFYDDCAMQGYGSPSRVYGLPDSHQPTSYYEGSKSKTLHRKSGSRAMPTGCWVDKNGEVQKISEMTDQYLNNLIRFLERNPQLIKQNYTTFEQMIEERYSRRNMRG